MKPGAERTQSKAIIAPNQSIEVREISKSTLKIVKNTMHKSEREGYYSCS